MDEKLTMAQVAVRRTGEIAVRRGMMPIGEVDRVYSLLVTYGWRWRLPGGAWHERTFPGNAMFYSRAHAVQALLDEVNADG